MKLRRRRLKTRTDRSEAVEPLLQSKSTSTLGPPKTPDFYIHFPLQLTSLTGLLTIVHLSHNMWSNLPES